MINYVHLPRMPIFEMLTIEEALLRADDGNWCLIMDGSLEPSVVMGIGSQVDDWVDRKRIDAMGVPVIKRFSGGGTVVVDPDTIFVTFILNNRDVEYQPYPETILKHHAKIYQKAFGMGGFSARENDFVIGDHKVGGNAYYIQKDRHLMHTSFLWDFLPERMEVLLHPKRAPNYRQNRPHTEFLACLKNFFKEKQTLFLDFQKELNNLFNLTEIEPEQLLRKQFKHHRKSLKRILN
ncbi:MAG: hypothetical protein S4CHLAM102_07130 [Chlamydiia bacterium]|nr:hypothetical protein [Chlamydiia bacterium]